MIKMMKWSRKWSQEKRKRGHNESCNTPIRAAASSIPQSEKYAFQVRDAVSARLDPYGKSNLGTSSDKIDRQDVEM